MTGQTQYNIPALETALDSALELGEIQFIAPAMAPEFLALDSIHGDGNTLLVGGPSGHQVIGEMLRQRAEHSGKSAMLLRWPETTSPVPILASDMLEDRQHKGLKRSLLEADVLIIADFVTLINLFPARLFALLACRLEAGRSNILLVAQEKWELLGDMQYRPSASVVARLDAAGTVPKGAYVDRSWRYNMPMPTVLERLGIGIFIDGVPSRAPLLDRIRIPDSEAARYLRHTLKFLPMSWAVNGDVAECCCVIEPIPTWRVLCSFDLDS
jgi:hypothetical protein